VPAEISAFIGLGSNLASMAGSPADTVLAAVERLAGWSEGPFRKSSLWVSEPVGCPPGSPPFINAVVSITPGLGVNPHDLLRDLLELEAEFGRQRSGLANEPRSLDLDLLCFGDRQITDPVLTLPHPAAHCRGFVLLPLAEIAPGFRLPGQQRTVEELASMLSVAGPQVARIAG